MIIEIIVSLFLLSGAFFLLVGSIGLTRLPDFYMRLHAPTKASTLGIGLILIAAMVFHSAHNGWFSVKEILIVLFIFLTAPITAHMLAKAALHVRQQPTEGTQHAKKIDHIRDRL